MKKYFVIALLLCVNMGFAQEYSEHYYKRKALFEGTANSENEIIFLGNSITEGGNWKALFPNKNVINRGISGDVSEGILFRLDEVTSSKPTKVFLMIGTNDLARGKSIAYVIAGTNKIIQRILQESESTKVYLQSILPVNPTVGKRFSGHKSNQQKIVETNKKLKALAKVLQIQYIDLHKAMRNDTGNLKVKYTYDGLHLSNQGYKKWKKVLKIYVN